MSEQKFDPIFDESAARELYVNGDAAHDFDHVLRVTRLAEQIARAEGADVQVVRLAALLHDVPVSDTRARPSPGRGGLCTRSADSSADWEPSVLKMSFTALRRTAFAISPSSRPRWRPCACTMPTSSTASAPSASPVASPTPAPTIADCGSSRGRDVDVRAEPPEGSDYTPVHEFVYKLQRLLATLHTESCAPDWS